MSVNFGNLFDHIISIDDFQLKWRFTEAKYDMLPDQHLAQLKPLDKIGSQFLSNYILQTSLHDDIPFKKDFFRTIDKTKILTGNEKEIKKWLYQRGIAFDKPVFLSWDNENSMIVPWKILIKYFDSFYYPSSDDLTVFDQSMDWALLFFHDDEIYFGTNKEFTLSDLYNDIDF